METTLLQRLVPTEIRGQVFGARHSLAVAAAPLGAAFGGVLQQYFPAPRVIAVAGLACIHDERFGCQQRFDVFEQKESLLATRNKARRWRIQDAGCAFDLGGQRRDTCLARAMLRPGP